MAALNSCCFIGHVGGEPEFHNTASARVANFSIAVSERFKDRNGQDQERTEWVRCCAWGNLAEIVDRFVHKGRLVYVGGKMTTRSWTNRDGAKQYSTQINVNVLQLLDRRDDSRSNNDTSRDGRGENQGYGQGYRDEYDTPRNNGYEAPPSGWVQGADEDLPF